jgi:micrococcal nuclease
MARRVFIGMLVLAVAAAGLWWFALRGPEHTAAPAATAAPTAPSIPEGAFTMTVESVHDGDTLRAHVDTPNAVVTDLESTRVRLLGIDTPEISPQLDCWGNEATVRLTALTPPGSTIWVTPDVEILDRYGRHLLYIWTPDGRFVNAELVAAGDARTEVYAPNTLHEDLFRSLEASAHASGAGQWGACG